MDVKQLTMSELEAGLEAIRQSPREEGVLEMIVRRPYVDGREVLDECGLDPAEGLVGDNWKTRKSARTADGSPHPDMQLNIMNARVIALVAQAKDRWPLAGDQLFIDLDLSGENLPPGTRLSLGSAVIEVTPEPHTGCRKFVERFGLDAVKFVNSPLGRELHLRGINARVIEPGVIRVGDLVRKADPLDVLVAGFLAATLPREEWTHVAHLSVGTWHVQRFGAEEALKRMRTGIRRLNDHHGTVNSATSGYHETVTRAYVRLLSEFLRTCPSDMPLPQRVERLVGSWLADKNVLLTFYRRETLMSPQARAHWVEPDLAPLPS